MWKNATTTCLAWLAGPVLLQLGGADQLAVEQRPNHPPLVVYDFNLDLGPAGNMDYLDSLGFSGLVTRVDVPADLPKLSAYAQHVETVPGFDLLAYVSYDFDFPPSSQIWRLALPTLAQVGAPLWVIVRGAPSSTALRELLEEMAIESQAAGVETVIYPHWGTDIESADEAAALIGDIGHPNLKSSLHTCHEIRIGNQYALDTVAAQHAQASSLVTIAGAENGAYAGPFSVLVDWSDAILPLDQGDFSLLPFLQALHDADYDRPVVLHTFGITDDPGHLERSLEEYAAYLEQIVR
ncbi:MAG: TIM barrel protein [Planctomycetota bacterium]